MMNALPRGAELVIASQPNKERAKAVREAYEETELPEALARPLVFGNKEQITALRQYESNLAQLIEGEEDEDGTPIPRRWSVEVSCRGSHTVEVEAATRQEAEERALDMVDPSDFDLEVEDSELIRPQKVAA